MTILIDEKKTTTDSYFYKVPCITSTFTAEILFVNDELNSVICDFDRVPIRERFELYGAIAEKIAELEKKYWLTLVDEKLKPVIKDKPTDIKLEPLTDDSDDSLTEVIAFIHENIENPYMDEYHYDENIKVEYIELINEKGKCVRKQRKIYEAGTDNILAILDGFLKCDEPEVPTMQSFMDRFRDELPGCEIFFFKDSRGGCVSNHEYGSVDWHPEKGETLDQAIEEMKGKIDAKS